MDAWQGQISSIAGQNHGAAGIQAPRSSRMLASGSVPNYTPVHNKVHVGPERLMLLRGSEAATTRHFRFTTVVLTLIEAFPWKNELRGNYRSSRCSPNGNNFGTQRCGSGGGRSLVLPTLCVRVGKAEAI